ncbi:MAG: ABC transporter substrate-binding protein [Candidatus Wallbacteria bacterium]|nr:ABC transporter substrate-binding protein [Candidatus Wallbacteria bacterium]
MLRNIFLILLFAITSGCGKNTITPVQDKEHLGSGNKSVSGDSAVVALRNSPLSFNPLLPQNETSQLINPLLYASVVKEEPDGSFTGDIARKWEISTDGKIITFYLKNIIWWQDAIELTVADIKFTCAAIRSGNSNLREAFSRCSLEVVDAYCFRAVYDEPFAPALCSWTVPILPSHLLLRENLPDSAFNYQPIGAGPFSFTSYSQDDTLILSASQSYFLGRPLLDKLVFKIIPDTGNAINLLLQGKIDILELEPYQFQKYSGSSEFLNRFTVLKKPCTDYISIRFSKGTPLTDRNLRNALSLAIDRERFEGRPISSPFPPDRFENPAVKPMEFSPEKARKLLESRGSGAGGNSICLNYPAELSNQAAIIKDSWEKIGVTVTLKSGITTEITGETNVFLERKAYGSDPEFCDLPDGVPEIARLMAEGRRTLNMDQRKEIYGQVQKILAESQIIIFLSAESGFYAADKRFAGLKFVPGRGFNFQECSVPQELQKY